MSNDISPKVSVIVPVWNPGSGIRRCVESLRGQTLEDIELIFVDDCGTDGAMDIVRAAAAEDSRIRIITNTENVGPGISRNAAIDVARGEYLSFVDADDYVSPNFLEVLYTKAKSENLDIVKGRNVYELEDGTEAAHADLNERVRKGILDGKPLFRLFTYEHQSAIYRRALLEKYGIRYGTSRKAQDTTFLLKVCHRAKTFNIEESAEHYHCERSGSTMHNMRPHMLKAQLHAFSEQMDYIVENMLGESYVTEYVSERVVYLLIVANSYGKNADNKDAVSSFVCGIQNQIFRLPPHEVERMKSECFIVRVLFDHNVILVRRPYKLPWGKFRVEDYMETLTDWMDFITSHPSYVRDAEGELYRLFRETDSLHPNDKDRVRLLELSRRLPLRQRTYIHEMTTLPRSFAMEVMVKMLGGYRRLRHFLQLETK